MTVTYSVCIGGAGIDYSSVTSILYTYSAFSINLRFFLHQWVRATLAQLLGLGLPKYQLRVSDIAVTDSARFCGGGFDSISGIQIRCFDYSRVTRVRVLLTFYPTSLRYLRILASLRVTYCDPLLLAYPHIFFTCGPFIGFVGFFPVSQGYSCVCVDRHDDYSADSSTSLAQCGFLTNFAIFALVSVHLGKFGLSSLASIGNSIAFLCQLSLPIHLYLSPLVSSLGGQGCSPPSLVASVLFALGVLLL